MIELPWPPAKLSPNARGHWRSKEKARTSYKEIGRYLANVGTKPNIDGNIHLKITFWPPDKRPRDLDNCLASLKYALDGVALAWGINDTAFRPITIDWGQPIKEGIVVIEWD
jgi:crossover junction endodeoxyribonuclease RusA